MKPYEKDNAKEWKGDRIRGEIVYNSESEQYDGRESPFARRQAYRNHDTEFLPHLAKDQSSAHAILRASRSATSLTQDETLILPRNSSGKNHITNGLGKVRDKARTRSRRTSATENLIHRPIQQRHLKNTLGNITYERDNAAKAAWRCRRPHDGIFALPKSYGDIVSLPVQATDLGDARSQVNLFAPLEEIGVRTGSFVQPPCSVLDLQLLIWGSRNQVSAAKTALLQWINRSDRARAQKRMPSVHPMTEKQKRAFEIQMERAAARQKFRHQPDDNVNFFVTGAYLWSLDGIRPEDLLGSSYEALDPIRMFYQCYVTFDLSASSFRILSNNVPAVQHTIQRLKGVISEFVTRHSQDIENYLVVPPNADDIRKHVGIIIRPGSGGNHINGDIPVLVGANLTPEESLEWAYRGTRLIHENQKSIEAALRLCFKRLRFYRGRIRMRFLIGTFTLSTYKWNPQGASSIPLEEFIASMRLSGTKGTLNKTIVDAEDPLRLFLRTQLARDHFDPADVTNNQLADAAPVYAAAFDVKHPTSGALKLEVEFERATGSAGLHEATRRQWTRVDHGGSGGLERAMDSYLPLELYMIRLQKGATWKLQIAVDNNVDMSRITPDMVDFAESIQCESFEAASKTAGSKKQIVRFVTNSILRSFEQKTAWKYRLKNHHGYMVEFARYDTFNPHQPSSNDDAAHVATYWGASMYDVTWDERLSQNTSMEVGKGASWSSEFDGLLDSANQVGDGMQDVGLTGLLRGVQVVVDCLNSTNPVKTS